MLLGERREQKTAAVLLPSVCKEPRTASCSRPTVLRNKQVNNSVYEQRHGEKHPCIDFEGFDEERADGSGLVPGSTASDVTTARSPNARGHGHGPGRLSVTNRL